MRQTRSLKDAVCAAAADYRSLDNQKSRFDEEFIAVNLSRMPILLFYFTLAFITNLIFNFWVNGTPIALHDWVFSGITFLFWLLYLGCALGKIRSGKAKRRIYGSFFILSNLYLLIFIGMDIFLTHAVYNYLLGMFIIAILPLLTPPQSLVTIAMNAGFAITLANMTGNEDLFVQFIIGSSVFAAIISLKEYYSFLRIQSALQRLREIGEHDKLTGLFNRNVLDTRAAVLWRVCAEKAGPLAAAMVDIDHFKNYNDTYGHFMGDQCLEKVAGCIAQSASAELSIRYGGEEFLIFFSDLDLDKIFQKLADVQERIKGLNLDAGAGSIYPKLTVSIGVAQVIPTPESSLGALIDEADKQLYLAKESGRNCICGL